MDSQYLNMIQAVGIGGVFALIVIDKVFEFISKKKYDGSAVNNELHLTLSAISRALDRQTTILDRMYQDCARCREELTRINGKLTHHKS